MLHPGIHRQNRQAAGWLGAEWWLVESNLRSENAPTLGWKSFPSLLGNASLHSECLLNQSTRIRNQNLHRQNLTPLSQHSAEITKNLEKRLSWTLAHSQAKADGCKTLTSERGNDVRQCQGKLSFSLVSEVSQHMLKRLDLDHWGKVDL